MAICVKFMADRGTGAAVGVFGEMADKEVAAVALSLLLPSPATDAASSVASLVFVGTLVSITIVADFLATACGLGSARAAVVDEAAVAVPLLAWPMVPFVLETNFACCCCCCWAS